MKWFSPTFALTQLTQLLLAQQALRGATAMPVPPSLAADTPGPLQDLRGAAIGNLAGAPGRAAPAWHFAPPPPALAPADVGLLSASVHDGVAHYVDLQATALRLASLAGGNRSAAAHAARDAALAFPERFRIVYREGQRARARAAAALERYRLAEDDPLVDPADPPPAVPRRRPAADRHRADRQSQADLRVFEQRRQGVDRFFRELRITRNALHAAISPNTPPDRAAAAREFIRAKIATAVDRARSPLADGVPPLPFAPDTAALRLRVDALLLPLEAPTPATALTTLPATTPSATAATTAVPTITAAATPRRLPLPDFSQRDLAVRDISHFYAEDSPHIMGTFRQVKLPNAPEIASLGVDGVVTYLGPDALPNALKFGPRQHKHSKTGVSMKWKYGSQLMVDADVHDRIPIRRLRYQVPGAGRQPPYLRYADIDLRGHYYRINGGNWRISGYPLDERLEQAKYLRITALMREAARRHYWIVNHEDHDPRDFTGLGWLHDLFRWLDPSYRRRAT